MTEIRKDLMEASKLYRAGKYEEALEIFEKNYSESPEAFRRVDITAYCWAIYQVHIKNSDDENELFEYVQFITDITSQADLNRYKTCPYTFSVFKVLKLLHNQNDSFNLIYWLEKINPDLLDQKRNTSNGRTFRSRKEEYFDYATKAYLDYEDFETCIEVSKKALSSIFKFTNNSDTWYRWRIAKSLRQLGQPEEALKYLNEVVKVKTEWYIYKEFADNYFMLDDNEKALNCISRAVLTNDPINMKVNLFALIYDILKDSESDIALRHAELYYLIKLDTGSSNISEEIEELEIDDTMLDKNQLISQIRAYWTDFKFKDQDLQYGTVTRFFDDKNYGFIRTDDDESIFFHRREFKGDDMHVGQLVSFYTEKSFDKVKGEESLIAVNVKAE